jgi:PAS domain S-box-containing protein
MQTPIDPKTESMLGGDGLNSDMLLRALAGIFNEGVRPSPSKLDGDSARLSGPDLQDRYRALVEQIPAVVFMAPLDGGIGEAYVSPQIERAIGFTQEEWLGDPVLWYKQIHPDDKVRWSAEAAQMLMTGSALKSTYRVLARNGRVIWLHCEARLMRTQDQRPWFIHGVGFDITELKQTEEALQEERNFVTAILDTVEALVLVLDPEGRIIRCNRACEPITGYPPSELQNKYVWEVLMVPDNAKQFQKMLQQTQAERTKHEHESRLLTRTGDERLIAWSGTVLADRGRGPVYTIVTGIDITERKRLEQRELERQAAKIDETLDLLQRLIDSMSEALLLVDVSGHVIRMNRAAGSILERHGKETIGRPLSEVLLNTEIPSSPFDCQLESRGSLYLEPEICLPGGQSFPASVSCVQVREKGGQVTGLLLVIQDITQRKQTEEMLRKTEKLATAGRLAASIAHEINNPLAAVTNLLYLMKKHPARINSYLELATQELDRIIHISKQTLGFYRDTSVPCPVNVAEVLDNVLYLYARRLEGREIIVNKAFDRKANIQALAGEIRQVFSNLISNALDAMAQGGTLKLKVSQRRSWKNSDISGVRVTIGDTGAGISPEHAKKIFEAFYTTKTDVGTGLGLWVTQGIIKKHNGFIRFRSRTAPGKSGTVFSVFLPQKGLQAPSDTEKIAS